LPPQQKTKSSTASPDWPKLCDFFVKASLLAMDFMTEERCISVDGTEVWLQGQGEVVLMLHGWPDTKALWDGTVSALADRYTCARLTLPGFESGPQVTSLVDMCQLFIQIIERISPNQPVTLMLHDWGCLFGYELAMRHPERVARVVAVDVGDHNSRALLRSWSSKEKISVMGYQVWLALAWKLGHYFSDNLGTRMTRAMARWLRCPTDPTRITYKMNYPYAMQWLGTAGGFQRAAQISLPMPLLFVYGERKPFMFHSKAWLEKVAISPGSAVQGLPCGHWVMISRPEAFHARVRDWLVG
jgi:pimeloyl-ACP methyl ester carboxylesterase